SGLRSLSFERVLSGAEGFSQTTYVRLRTVSCGFIKGIKMIQDIQTRLTSLQEQLAHLRGYL
ncbi:MAG: hypothetical protein MJA29_12935, partial [Candidatus Omnitrophica bacterium]|nr:hypothetical protein [Candidatus Omnitrophota bacterium]